MKNGNAENWDGVGDHGCGPDHEPLEKNPKDKEALEIIGRIYLSLGRYGQAEEFYQQIVDLTPNDAMAQQTLQRIRRQLRKL